MQQELTMGSLFSGSGGFELASAIFGIEPRWASEIEPLPMLITKKNFPDMPHHGDIRYMNGGKVEAVTVIAGGSPCQDMSVAGQRAGLDGSRSNLFHEQIRIIKEMREHDRKAGRTGKYIRPRFMVWENVPGAFSSNKGKDFQAVLQAIVSVTDDCLQFLSLRKENGRVPDVSWATLTPSLGERLMPNTGECPREESESTLSQILEAAPHQKYYLSEKACLGILRRAEKRGKELPEILKRALIKQAQRMSNVTTSATDAE